MRTAAQLFSLNRHVSLFLLPSHTWISIPVTGSLYNCQPCAAGLQEQRIPDHILPVAAENRCQLLPTHLAEGCTHSPPGASSHTSCVGAVKGPSAVGMLRNPAQTQSSNGVTHRPTLPRWRACCLYQRRCSPGKTPHTLSSHLEIVLAAKKQALISDQYRAQRCG